LRGCVAGVPDVDAFVVDAPRQTGEAGDAFQGLGDRGVFQDEPDVARVAGDALDGAGLDDEADAAEVRQLGEDLRDVNAVPAAGDRLRKLIADVVGLRGGR
jgi:hypothetical protein